MENKNIENPLVWQRLSIQTAQFVLAESEKVLIATIDTAKTLTDRAVNIFQFSIPVAIGTVVVLFTKGNHQLLDHLSFMALIICGLVSWKSLQVYKLYEVLTSGNTPEKMLNPKKLDTEGDQQLKAFLISTILAYQNSIEFNVNENKRRSAHIHQIMTILKYGVGVLILYSILWFPVFQSVFAAVVADRE